MKDFFVSVVFLASFGMSYNQQCMENEFECPDGKCIHNWTIYDDFNDYEDWSDNSDDCQPCRRQCPNGYCIPDWWICDGFNDCGDWRDEPEDCPPCQVGYWRCPNENCIPELWSTFVMETTTRVINSPELLAPMHVRFTKFT